MDYEILNIKYVYYECIIFLRKILCNSYFIIILK